MLKNNHPFSWDKETDNAFVRLRNILSERPILQTFSPKKYTELHTDASALGLAGMLLQRDTDGKMHLVYAISRRTSEAEQFYHSSKLELLAIIWAVSRLRRLLINIPFKIITDCQALVYMNTYRTKNAQIVRWHHLLSEYDYEIAHREGTKLAHVDALSRAPVDEPEHISRYLEEIRDVLCINDTKIILGVFNIIEESEEVLAFQFNDEELKQKQSILKKPARERTRIEKDLVKDFQLVNGILYKKSNENLCYVVPKGMRKSLVVRYHDLNGHQGVERTFELMSRKYYFCGMRRYVKQHVYACFQCLAAKSRPGRQAGVLHPIPPGNRPFHTIHIDHVGPFIKSSRGNKFVFVLIDNLTKYVVLTSMRDTKTANVLKCLENFICDFGAPARIISDRGTCFTAKAFNELCTKHGIKHVLTSPRHPQANGQVERVNATLVPLMQANTVKKDCKDWDAKMKQIQRDLNEAKNATTGKSPFESLYGFIPSHDEGALREFTKVNETYNPNHVDRHIEIAKKIVQEQQGMKLRYDKNRATNVKFKKGDLVFCKSSPVSTGDSTKLQYKNRRNLLVVTEVLPSDTYKIVQLSEDKNAKRYSTNAHATQLKLWKPHIDECDEKVNEEIED